MSEYLKKITDKLPKVKGSYMTNIGELPFDGKSFLIRTGNRFFPTVIEYWLSETEGANKPPVLKAAS